MVCGQLVSNPCFAVSGLIPKLALPHPYVSVIGYSDASLSGGFAIYPLVLTRKSHIENLLPDRVTVVTVRRIFTGVK